MANLHKTERKLPWWVRDGGLPSDWLGGRIGGNSLQSHSQTCVACQTQQPQAHTSSHAELKFAFGCYVKSKKKKKCASMSLYFF